FFIFCFFFQAEDGIRDFHVTGVQTCALPISGGLKKKLLVVLNDNKMSICPRTGGLATALDKCRMTHFYQDSKRQISRFLSKVPQIGRASCRERVKMSVVAA